MKTKAKTKTVKPSFFIYKFYAIGNGGMECYTTHRVYAEDPAKDTNMEDLTDGVLGGNYSSGVRCIKWELVKNPSPELIEKMITRLTDAVADAQAKVRRRKNLIALLTNAKG